LAAGEAGVSNEPLGADHLYVSAPGFGPAAEAETAKALPARASTGETHTAVTVPQLKVVAVTRAEAASGLVEAHWSVAEMGTNNVDGTLKVAVPAHTARPSTEVPESKMT
jgi:hypothetical protein